MKNDDFEKQFEALTGHAPFPWQCVLYKRFLDERTDNNIPSVADLPTGLGKTSVIAVWLLALIAKPNKMPRRLVYVVNRRTVVDQTTAEVMRYRQALDRLGVSTLRGQFADNHQWSADPSRPAIICGTVDMIGSRLLFEGYRIGFKSRPLHAGFLGQDALLVHDEAHLEPAFQKLIETIQDEQKKERQRNGDLSWPGLRVMALSATAREDGNKEKAESREPFGLTDEEKQPPEDIPEPPTEPIHHVWRRLKAKKSLRLHAVDDEKKLADKIASLALEHKSSNAAVLIFVRTIDDVNKVCSKLTDKKNGVLDEQVRQLTGTMRGYERDKLVKDATFQRFLRPLKDADRTVYLVCTSAGEVGVNISADHMVCDLSTFDSMAQRLGRANRFGERVDTRVDVVHPGPENFDDKNKLTPARKATLKLLQQLNGDASPKALGELPADQRLAAFAPEPTILPATDILFDVWTMTTIKNKMPGRPPVAPYLHGVAEWEPPRTSVAWREEVEMVTGELIQREGQDFPQELLADYPLKPHELLSDRTDRVLKALQSLATKHGDSPVWLVDDQQQVRVSTLGKIANPAATKAADRNPLAKALADGIVLLSPFVGGLFAGMLSADSEKADDVADEWFVDKEKTIQRRARVWDDEESPQGMALIRTIDINPLADESASPGEQSEVSTKKRFWHWYARPHDAEDTTRASAKPITWEHHTRDVAERTTEIVEALNLSEDLKQAVILAAELHDLGKQRELWQRAIGNPDPSHLYAKSGRRGSRYKPDETKRWLPGFRSSYRHEFGSLLDALDSEQQYRAKLDTLSEDMRDVVLHLIAAHHGYARPHFLPEGTIDPKTPSSVDAEAEAIEVMRRYARLQRKYGRWGLAYLESLLRAADWAASAEPSTPEEQA